MNGEIQIELVPGSWCPQLGRNATFAHLLAVMPFDADDRPAPGTECAQCRMFGHYCQAKGMCGEYALCLSCGEGEACGQLAAVDRMQRGEESELFEAERGHVGECRSIAITDADRVVTERPVESAWSAKALLDPENLKKGLTRAARVPLAVRGRAQQRAVAKERSLGRRIAKGAAKKIARPATAKLPAANEKESGMTRMEFEAAKAEAIRLGGQMSINAIAKHTGYDWASVNKWLTAAGLPKFSPERQPRAPKKPALHAAELRRGKGPKTGLTVSVPVIAVADEMVSVKVSVKALDKLILLLPGAMKAAAIEKLLAEMA